MNKNNIYPNIHSLQNAHNPDYQASARTSNDTYFITKAKVKAPQISVKVLKINIFNKFSKINNIDLWGNA